tara:strand:- start:417 stop:614 length:198 start_codon:yes stop_codon:yes gene_type:complete
LVPDAAVVVELARSRADADGVIPSIGTLPDYFEESVALAVEYKFTVVAHDDSANFIKGVLKLAVP